MLVRVQPRALLIVMFLSLFALAAHGQEADLLVEKSGPTQAPADTDVSYTVVVTNIGPDDATNVTLTDNIPAGMTFTSRVDGAGFSCTDPGAGNSGTVTCTNPLMAASAVSTFTFVFHIDPLTPPGTVFTNTAVVGSQTFDPNEENNQSSTSTSTPPPATSDLGVTKLGPSGAAADTDVSYTLTFTNSGPDDDASATLTDTLPGTMTFVSLNQDSGPTANCTTGQTVTCTLAPMPSGSTATFTLVGHIPSGTPSGTSFENTATVSGSNDPNPENNSSTTVTTVSSVDVSVVKSGPASVSAGTNATYTITVGNSGPDTAISVHLFDQLPPPTTFVSFTHDSGPAAICSTPPPGANGLIDCLFASLGSGASAQFTLTLDPATSTGFTNTANVTSDSNDTNPSNDSSSVTTAVVQSADLGIVKTGPANVTAGNTMSFTISVSNAGPSNATSVTWTDTLPAGTTFSSLNQDSGPTFNCTTGATVTCSLASFAAGASASFTLTVQVNSSTADGTTLSNTATIASSTTDPNAGNNSSTASPTTATSADLTITKVGPAAVAPGDNLSYTVTVANAGPSDALSVQLTDTLPAGTSFVSNTQNSGPTFNCTNPAVGGTGTITCSIASLVAGASASFTFVFNVTPTTTGSITNSATVTSTTTDPTPGNTATTSPAVVSPSTTDLSITKTPDRTRVQAAGNVTYTIVATNEGPAVATNVVVTDVLPAGTTLVSATSPDATCSGTTTVTCTAPFLLSGNSLTITLVLTMPPTLGVVTNTATVTSDNADSDPANNASSAAVTVAPEVPALSPLALLMLACALGAVSMFVMRR